MIDKTRLILWCMAAVIPILGFGEEASAEPKAGGRVVITYGWGTPRHFNPAVQLGTSTAIVGTQVFASPLRYDENCNPQPYLAKSWKISEDGRSVTLDLVQGAVFRDGRPITSEDANTIGVCTMMRSSRQENKK
jgi:peptide/nickel transport system substrate-binding protein